MSGLRDRLVLAAKTRFFAGRGEPYRVGGKTLHFVPGTRPVRLRYQVSENAVNRYDAMQLAWMLENLAEGDTAIDVGAIRTMHSRDGAKMRRQRNCHCVRAILRRVFF